MGRYSIDVEKKAKKQLAEIYKSGNKSDIRRIEAIFAQLAESPETGIGNPEKLKYEIRLLVKTYQFKRSAYLQNQQPRSNCYYTFC